MNKKIVGMFGVGILAIVVILFCFIQREKRKQEEVQEILDELLPGYYQIETWLSGDGWETENRSVKINGAYYQKIIDTEYKSKEDVLNKVREVYTEEYIEKYCHFEGDRAWYINYENELYRLEADGIFIYLDELQKVVQKTDDQIVVVMSIKDSDGPETMTVYLVRQTEGWRINQIVG